MIRLQRAHAGSTHRDHPPTTGTAGCNGIDHLLTDLQPLAVHVVIFDAFDPYRLKSTGPDVQGHEGALDTPLGNARQQRLIEMQPGSRRRHRAGALGIDGLITLAIGGIVRAVYIRRQRHMADPIEQRQNLFGKAQLEQRVMPRKHLRLTSAIEQNRQTRLGRLARTHMGQNPMTVQHPFDQHLELAARRLLPE